MRQNKDFISPEESVMEPKIIQNGNFIEVIGHYDNEAQCAKMTLLADLYAIEHREGYAKFPLDVADKLELVDEKLEFPQMAGPFYNYFILNGIPTTVQSSLEGPPDRVGHLYIAYHNNNIYGIGNWISAAGNPTIEYILTNGELILENVNPEYTGYFFVNPYGSGTSGDPFYLVEDEVIDAGYFADFTTYHTEKQSSGYSITYHSNGGTPMPTDLTGQTTLPNPLPTVSKANFTFDGWYTDSTFTTPAVAGAEISADTDLYAKFTRTHITLDLSTIGLPAGTHSIQIKLSDDGVTKADSALSNAVTYVQYQQLTAPVISLSGSILTWQPVEHATSYELFADGTSKGTVTSGVDLSTLQLGVGSHSIYVVAKGSGYYADSVASNAVTYTQYQQLTAPVISLSGNILTWSAIPNASAYKLYADNTDKGTVTSGIDLTTLQLAVGTHSIQVMAVGSGYYTDSNKSNSVSYAVQPQGETWLLNSSITFINQYFVEFNFTVDGVNYTKLRTNKSGVTDEVSLGFYIDTYTNIWVYRSSTGWIDNKYRYLVLYESPSSAALSWLQTNGSKQ